MYDYNLSFVEFDLLASALAFSLPLSHGWDIPLTTSNEVLS
jgi:hypothetical protein